jgi:flagellar biosynthesis/type III secretory pathway chaperone
MKALEELLPLLDEQIEVLRQKLSLMKQVHDCVREAEPERLADLLRAESELSARMASLEERTVLMRRRMAHLAQVPTREATIGLLIERSDGPEAMALSDRRERLGVVVEQLRAECAATARLARHALEFNSRLLAALVGADGHTTTYSAQGEMPLECQGATFRSSV